MKSTYLQMKSYFPSLCVVLLNFTVSAFATEGPFGTEKNEMYNDQIHHELPGLNHIDGQYTIINKSRFETIVLPKEDIYVYSSTKDKKGLVEFSIVILPDVGKEFLDSTIINIDGMFLGFDRPSEVNDFSYRLLAIGGGIASGITPVSIIDNISATYVPLRVKATQSEKSKNNIGAQLNTPRTILCNFTIDYDIHEWWIGDKNRIPVQTYKLFFEDAIQPNDKIKVKIQSGMNGSTVIRGVSIN